MTGVWAPNTLETPRKLMSPAVPGWADMALTVPPAMRPCRSWSMETAGEISSSAALMTSTWVGSSFRSRARP